jgi:hypothetical protein
MKNLIKEYPKITTLIIGLIILFAGLPFIIVNQSKQSATSQNSTPSADTKVGVGKEGYLKVSKQTQILVASSKETEDRLVKLSVAQDTLGIAKMVLSGEAFFVDVGTKVLVIDSTFALREIRILEGKSMGDSGWVPFEFISSTK